MKNVLDIYDEVMIRSTKRKSSIIEVIEIHSKMLVGGKIINSTETKYRLEGFLCTFNPNEIVYIGQKPIKEEVIDSIIIDSLLAQKKFDYLKQLLDKDEDMKPDGYCSCGGAMYETYWKETNGLRCMDCGKIDYEIGR